MGTPTSPAQALQEALNQIEAQYNAAMVYVNAMNNDNSEIEKDNKSVAAALSKPWYYSTESSGGHNPVFHHHTRQSYIDRYHAATKDIAKMNSDIGKQEQNMKNTFGAAFANLNATLASLEGMMSSIASSHVSADLIASDMNQISALLAKLFQAYEEKVRSETDEAAMNGPGASNLTDAQLEQLAQDGFSAQMAEANTLDGMQSTMKTLINQYTKDYWSANVDENRFDIMDKIFKGAGAECSRDGQIMDNAENMIGGLGDVMKAMSEEIAEILPSFENVINVIQEILKEVKAILADAKLSPTEKQGKVLALVMYLMTFFEVVKQQVASEKAKNNQDMSQGSIQASQNNILSATSNEKIKEEAERNAKSMKITMLVMQVAMGALMMIMAPGIGSALMIAMVTAYEAMQTEGVVPDASQALGNAMGSKIGADVIIGVAEAGVMLGGGAAADAGFEVFFAKAIESTADTAVTAAASEIEEAAEEAAAAAGKAGDPAAIARATSTLTDVAELAAKRAATETARQFMNQSFGTLVGIMAKGAFNKTAEDLMLKAAQEAVESSIEDAGILAKIAAQGREVTPLLKEDFAKLGADKAVAKFSGKEASAVSKEADQTVTRKLAVRALTGFVYGMMTSGFLVDSLKKATHNDGAIITMELIQQLIQMIAMIAGSGMLSGSNMEGVVSNIPRAAGALSVVPQIGQTVGAFTNAQIQTVEGKAVTRLSMNGSVADLLHSFLEQLQKDAGINRDIMTRDLEQGGESTSAIAGHMQDGDRAAIQVLLSAV